ncbi:MAG: energy-coupling factor transporter transmembrane component T [Metallosphaera sp.]|uniref:energy-coupling factor transporter transmembrane component T family protein n=1 Tax=Metallosphaera sp. TaxID=2020860 RepID=UPI0031680636
MSLISDVVSWYLYLFGLTFPIYLLFAKLGFTGFKRLTSYVESKTFLHELNPVTKFVILLLLTVVSSQSIWWVGAIAGLITLSFFFFLRRLRLVALFSLMQLIGTSWGSAIYASPSVLNLIFGPDQKVLWVFPSYFSIFGVNRDLTEQALIYGFQISMRVWPMFLFSFIILMTTTVTEVIDALSELKAPLALTFALGVAILTIPRIFDVAETAYKIQVMRGEKRIIALFRSIVPTTVFLFRKAVVMGISAETRCFMATKRRTELQDLKFSARDKVALVISIVFASIDLYLVAIGLIPAVPFR